MTTVNWDNELLGGQVVERGESLGRRLVRSPRMIVGLTVTGFVVLLAFAGPLVAPHNPNALLGRPYQPPGQFALGTDYLGRDVLSRVLNGGRTVVWMATAAATLGMVSGVGVGLMAGYLRSRLDTWLMRAMEVLQAFPIIILVLLVISMVGTRPWLVVVVVAIGWTPQVARVTRGITLEVVERDFVRIQEVLGASTRRILVREILPNLASPLLVEFALRVTWSVAVVAALSFIGFGIQPPTADWGLMINENRSAIAIQPWAILAPILCIGLLTVGVTLIAEALALELAGTKRRTVER
jgi:peptide/nickel transport system permease protein